MVFHVRRVCGPQILGSPQRLLDLAGPCSAEPETRKRSFSKRKSHLDLLKLSDSLPVCVCVHVVVVSVLCEQC